MRDLKKILGDALPMHMDDGFKEQLIAEQAAAVEAFVRDGMTIETWLGSESDEGCFKRLCQRLFGKPTSQ